MPTKLPMLGGVWFARLLCRFCRKVNSVALLLLLLLLLVDDEDPLPFCAWMADTRLVKSVDSCESVLLLESLEPLESWLISDCRPLEKLA